jgi:hypothetical protein
MRLQGDVLFLIIIMPIVVIGFILAVYVMGQVTGALQPQINPTNSSNTVVGGITAKAVTAQNTFGDLLVIVYFAIGIGAIVSAFFTDTSPVFFILSVLILVVEILVSVILHNVFFTFAQNSFIITYANQFPLLLTIFEYYPELTFVIALGVVVALYAK